MSKIKPKSELDQQTASHAAARNALILGLFALVSTGLIALTHLLTKDQIAEEIELAIARRLNQIISPDEYSNDFYRDCIEVIDSDLLGSTTPHKIYRLRNNNQPVGLFMTTTAPDGYAGKIQLVLGIYVNGELAGVRVTSHQETPGLGDKIEESKSDWVQQFNLKSLDSSNSNQWKVKKDGGDFDSLTGATITPRAIIKAVQKALLFYQNNQNRLFKQASQCGVNR
ncbi:electron transport complex subunit RsxG [Aliikangiella sp. IMCC44653]